jgi:cellulose synthase/poly-beta-1,6-N-acetylglucosamine synthase-like glycosyltransferase
MSTNTAYAIKGWAIFGFTIMLLCVCIYGATQFENILAWSAGLIYLAYDTWRLLYLAMKTRNINNKNNRNQNLVTAAYELRKKICNAEMKVGLLVSVHNGSHVILNTIDHLLRQNHLPNTMIIVNDGSTDDTRKKISEAYRFIDPSPDSNNPLSLSSIYPRLLLLNKEKSGKADSLNFALKYLDCDLVITVDAGTLLGANAVYEMKKAFIRSPELVAACGILQPARGEGLGTELFGIFHYFEYLRAFLSRVAWSQQNALLSVSGAFSAYDKRVLVAVGGYDTSSLVEDYELIHRMHKLSGDRHFSWKIEVIERAQAVTHAPATFSTFIEERQRQFTGFLRTQYQYRKMIGAAKYHHLGKCMLPIKTMDSLQPIFGIIAFYFLWKFMVTNVQMAMTIFSIIAIKMCIDGCFYLWALSKYHRWLGQRVPEQLWLQAIVFCVIEPLFFQPLCQLCALMGWFKALKGLCYKAHPISLTLKKFY